MIIYRFVRAIRGRNFIFNLNWHFLSSISSHLFYQARKEKQTWRKLSLLRGFFIT
jgi:hypothetical protein